MKGSTPSTNPRARRFTESGAERADDGTVQASLRGAHESGPTAFADALTIARDHSITDDPTEIDARAAVADETGTNPVLVGLAQSTTTGTTQALAGDSILGTGEMIGDYRIQRKVGEGGWGTVYFAIHPVIGKRAAVKVLKKSLSQQPSFVRRFIDEARAVNQIGHPNIVDVYTFGETEDGRSYFVMEWLDGQTLSRRLRSEPLALPQICEIGLGLARALDAAHEKGIIHRDLKPDNVFLVEARGDLPRVKLLDFGIAKFAGDQLRPRTTATGQIVGTPIYMAPEQARGGHIDHRVDIYSLGGILFESLTGRTPYGADNAAEQIVAHLTHPPPRPSSLGASVPTELDNLVVAMLAKDPDDRPSMRRVHEVLDRCRGLPAAPAKRSVGPGLPSQLSNALRGTVRSASAGARRAVRLVTEQVRPRDLRTWWLVLGGIVALAIFALAIYLGFGRRSADLSTTGEVIVTVPGLSSFQVLVDGRGAELDSDGGVALTPGAHMITVTAPGMQPESFRVDMSAGLVLRESIELQRNIDR